LPERCFDWFLFQTSILLACAFLRLGGAFDFAALSVLSTSLKSQFSISNLGSLFSAHTTADIFSPFAAALLVSQYGPQIVLMISVPIACIGVLLQSVAVGGMSSYGLFYFGTFLASLGFGVASVCASVWICALYKSVNLGAAIAFLIAFDYIGRFLCGLTAPKLTELQDGRMALVFWIATGFAGLCLLIVLFMCCDKSVEFQAGKGLFCFLFIAFQCFHEYCVSLNFI
jgi:MFS family permease